MPAGLPPEVAEGIAIQQRFWQIDPETGEHRENNSDMALKAANLALASIYQRLYRQEQAPQLLSESDRAIDPAATAADMLSSNPCGLI